MGNYNLEYENYYKNFSGGNKSSSYLQPTNSNNKLAGKIIQDLIGTFILFAFMFFCKTVHIPQTEYAYKYSKNIVSKNYDYKKVVTYFSNLNYKSINLNSLEKSATDNMEELKSKISGKETTEQWIKRLFIKPVEGKITSGFGNRNDPTTGAKKFHSGVDIDAKENTDVMAVFDGIVKDCGENPELGKYIILSNGNDVETKYGHLNETLVKKQDKIIKGKVIGKTGNTGKSTGPHLHFEIIYMGEARDPLKYISFATK